jgi:hypothetical protein
MNDLDLEPTAPETPATEAAEDNTPSAAPRRRRARAQTEDDGPSSPAKTQKYVVRKAAIAPYGGGRGDLLHPGAVVELSADLAKHYNKLGFLAPYIED